MKFDSKKALGLIAAIEEHRASERRQYWSQIDPGLHPMFEEILELRSAARNASEEADVVIVLFDCEEIQD